MTEIGRLACEHRPARLCSVISTAIAVGLPSATIETMSAQDYLQSLLTAQTLSDADLAPLRQLRQRVEGRLSALPGKTPRFYYGGSYGKNTMIRERYDLDIVIYWPQTTSYTIKDIYDMVGRELKKD